MTTTPYASLIQVLLATALAGPRYASASWKLETAEFTQSSQGRNKHPTTRSYHGRWSRGEPGGEGRHGVARRMLLLGISMALIVSMWASPVLAVYRTDTGSKNCPRGEYVLLLLRYKGDAGVTYTNANGTFFVRPLPYHRSAATNFHDTYQNHITSWKLKILSDKGYVSRQGSYAVCVPY